MSDLSKGILLVCISVLANALMSLFYKLIPADVSIYEKLLTRGAASVIIAYSFIYAMRRKAKTSNNPGQIIPAYFSQKGNFALMLVRAVSGSLAILTYIYIVDALSLSDADMLNKLAAVFIIIIGAFWLKSDSINLVQVLVVIISLVGAAFIIKPSFDNPLLGSYLIGILQAILAAIAYLAVRYLLATAKNKEHPISVESSYALVTLLISVIPAVYYFTGWEGKALAYTYLALATAFAVVAQYTFSYAMKFAPAVEVNVYQYLSLLWTSLFGWIFFAFIPDFYTVLGYVLIIFGGVMLYVYNLRQYRQAKAKLN
ncbi:hypothetical protein CJP74_01505 [Psittacicella melopsittaci]|uniref:EamA domain-containing protein n=1 Tax=Psittacicella melopsittaci TaxID=2028576 RepID=A0A3A1Y8N6_9GAMM|nr:DMT family transporter [Psittacicella melopsittaci]RIY33568.1 hypothetical protein CJP74_01505 [Psittacicella melopsittaci]